MGKDIEKRRKIIVTDALPYANGPLHIGHVAGVHLPSDIYTRYLRKRGKKVIHICGTDEHGAPISLSAEKQGISPGELVEKNHRIIKESLKKLGVEFDNFSGTSRKVHHDISRKLFLDLMKRDYLETRTTEEFYCPECEKFLPDRYIEGTCPYCGYEDARGDSCESCGSWLDPDQLKNPRCKVCGGKPVKKKTTHWYFKLNEFQEKLENWIGEKDWRKNVKKYLKGWLDEGLRPRAITRDLDWGVKVPLEKAGDKVMYVWFEAPIGYISSTIEWANRIDKPEQWREYWKDEDTYLVHFIGKDNIVFHGIIWPAILMGVGQYTLPDEIPANEFLNLEGRQLSTSKNWAVWLHEYLEDFNPDFLRYYLTCIMPETKDSEFKWEEFQERVNQELINNLGNFVNRTLKFINKYGDGKIPEPGDFEKEDRKILEKKKELIDKIEESLSEFHFRRAVRAWMKLSSEANRYYDAMEPWKTRKKNPKRTSTTLYICTHLVRTLACIGELFIPFGAENIFSMLKLEAPDWKKLKELDLPAGHKIGKVEPLYEKIEDSEIEKQLRRLSMAKVSIEDFKGMGLKIGVIEEVEDISGADKLYKLKVDTGEKRTLVAGIKENYSKEELTGRKIVVVTNLEPATIMGVRSEGMLLAATEGDTISIVSPDKDISPGSDVS